MTTAQPALARPQAAPPFITLPSAARWYVSVVVLAGAAALAGALARASLSRPDIVLALLALDVVTSEVKIRLPLVRGHSTLSFSCAIVLFALPVLGPAWAATIAALGAWAQCTFHTEVRNPAYRKLFSSATAVLAALAAGFAFEAAHGMERVAVLGIAVPLGCAAAAFFVVNSGLIAGAIGLSTSQRPDRVWLREILFSAPAYLVSAAGAAMAATLATQGQYALVLVVGLPLVVSYWSYRAFVQRVELERAQVRQVSEVQLETIERLALAIEAKDRTSPEQIRRMQVYAEALARAAGMDEGEIRGVRTAALLHDVGNLAVPEHILAKKGPLSADEFERVRIHPRVGADILDGVPFPYPVADLILAHHERWDGRGYPQGLTGSHIPLGARVLAIVDTFTAMLFDRPYRAASSQDEALDTVRRCAGSSLDPQLSELFVSILPEIQARLRPLDASHDPSTTLLSNGYAGPDTSGALDDIARARNEGRVLYELAQALGGRLTLDDTMRVVAAKLERLLPCSGLALFLHDQTNGWTCRTASGPAGGDFRSVVAATIDDVAALASAGDGTRIWRSILVAPLEAADGPPGALVVYDVHAGAYDDQHRRIFQLVAAQAAQVVPNAVVFEQTHEASLTDALTGLPNRRALERHLGRAVADATRDGEPFTLLLLDLDGLKVLNDVFGHHAGDVAIKSVAAALRAGVRDRDLASRYAGDEFVVVLSNCDAQSGDRRSAELQDGVGRLSIEPAPGQRAHLGISAGRATYPADGATLHDLLEMADQRMYENKRRRKQARLPESA